MPKDLDWRIIISSMCFKESYDVYVPNLRFKEFQGEWELKKLKDMIDIKAGYAFPSNNMLTEKSTYQLIKMSNVYQSELRLDRNPSFWQTIDSKQKEFLLNKGDTILTLTGTVGKQDFGYSAQIDEDDKYLLNQRLVVLRYVKDKSTSDFIKQLVANKKFLFDFFGVAKGGTGNQANVGIDDLKSIIFTFPSIREQQKIASFLSLIDERITTQSKIIGELGVLKTTLAKKIFSQQLRFKDGLESEFPEWEDKKLQDICTIIGGGTPETNKIEYWNGDIQWFTPTEIKSNFVSKSERTISISGLKNSSAKLLPKGTILLTTRATIGEVAIALEECATNQGFQSLVVKKNNNNVFIFNWLKVNKFELEKRANGSTFPEISKSEIEKIEIVIPSLEEQTQIANFLSSIDTKLQTEKQILDQLEKQKKYLLQQMFI